MIEANLVVDASNKTCPLPVLYAKKALQTLSVNDTLLIICTDLKAEDDLKNFCKKKVICMLVASLKMINYLLFSKNVSDRSLIYAEKNSNSTKPSNYQSKLCH